MNDKHKPVEGLHHLQLLTIDARASSSCSSRISRLDHKILFSTLSMAYARKFNRQTDRDDAMEYNAVVVPSIRKLYKIFASLQLTNRCQFLPHRVKKKVIQRTRGVWSQYSSSCTSPKLVSSTTDSMIIPRV